MLISKLCWRRELRGTLWQGGIGSELFSDDVGERFDIRWEGIDLLCVV